MNNSDIIHEELLELLKLTADEAKKRRCDLCNVQKDEGLMCKEEMNAFIEKFLLTSDNADRLLQSAIQHLEDQGC